jgi:hypothetical protein
MAIYTTLSKKDIAKLVDEFALGDLVSFSGIRTGSVNTHYLIETKRAKFFAKVDEVKSSTCCSIFANKIFPACNLLRPKAVGIIWNFRKNA